MRIKNIGVKNFRLLENISSDIEEDITLIVGKNNTGKTSFFEAIKIATSSEGKFLFEDFSQSSYDEFKSIYAKYIESINPKITEEEKDELEKDIILKIPKIQVLFEIEYDIKNDSLIELGEFITDLDDSRNDAVICISYEPLDSLRMFHAYENREDKARGLIDYLHENINSYYKIRCYAIDKESDYRREIEDSFRKAIERVVLFESIQAMRILDDTKGDSNNALSEGFSKYYKERDKKNNDVIELEDALKSVSVELKDKYNKVLEGIIEKLQLFGAKTPITVPDITIDSKFDSEKVIKNNIQYLYKQAEIDLPESYNGLGYSNLIYMILELASFIEKFKNSKEEKLSNFLVVLIEEPEAHMHPQMQQVFISQISDLIKQARKENNLLIQVIITTHSSHILSEAGIDLEKGFNRIRYFNKTTIINKDKSTTIKINNQDFNGLKVKDDKRTFRFLKQYLTLHKSDLFFADKVILVEGVTERMLLPQMIKKTAKNLCSEYVSVLEVGGAYAHSFKELLEFIGVKTLIITDIDSAKMINDAGEEKLKKCPVAEGELTTNETLKQWLPKIEVISDLVSCPESTKVADNIRVAYQTEEKGFNGRSFEDSFINANKELFLKEHTDKEGKKIIIKNLFSYLKGKDLNEKIPAPSDSKVKTNFTFDIMCFEEGTYGEWSVPAYISEGLIWLAKND